MRRLDFEQAILEMVFESGYEQLTPSNVAYFLKIPIKISEQYLDELLQDSILDLEISENGDIIYSLPQCGRPTGETLQNTKSYRASHGEGGKMDGRPIPRVTPQRSLPVSSYGPGGDWSSETLPVRSNPKRHSDQFPVSYAQEDAQNKAERRSPSGAMFLSFLWPGLGQVYNGQPAKGLVLFFSSAFLWMIFLGWMVHLYALVDAGIVAEKINLRLDDRRRALPA